MKIHKPTTPKHRPITGKLYNNKPTPPSEQPVNQEPQVEGFMSLQSIAIALGVVFTLLFFTLSMVELRCT